jgi:hypothetical protein
MATQIQAHLTKQGPNDITGTQSGDKRGIDVYMLNAAGATEYETRVDEPSSTTTYVGQASVGSDISDSVWRIKRILVSGTETIIEWADGDSNFDNVWNNRASLTYS